jgi:hypothetical protein
MPDIDINVFLKIFSSWQVIAVTLVMLVLFPVIFYMASFGKAPKHFKKKVQKKVSAKEAVVQKHIAEDRTIEQREKEEPSASDETEEA